MKEFLNKLIANKKAELKRQEERMKASTDVNEVRSLGETLIALRDEIADAEKQLAELDKEDPAPNPTDDEGRSAGLGLDPKRAMGSFKMGNGDSKDEDPLGTMTYRTAFMNYAQKGIMSDVLKRADDHNISTDLGVLLPTTVVQEIITGVEKVYGQLYSRVRKTNIKGGVKYPIGSFSATFKRITETGAPTDRQKGGSVTGYVEFSYNIGEIRLAQTLLASVLSVPVFEAELAKVIVKAYVEAMDKEIMTGVAASNQCEGILTEAAKSNSRIPAANIIEFTADEVADWTKWEEKLFAEIPLSMEGLRPEFVMAKQTYVSNLCTLKDNNNQPINKAGFDVTDKQYKFNEYPVLRVEKDIFKDFNSATNGEYFGMFWVPEEAYAINTNLEFFVKRYFDEEKNEYVDKALVINDGKILDPKYIYLLKKKVTA